MSKLFQRYNEIYKSTNKLSNKKLRRDKYSTNSNIPISKSLRKKLSTKSTIYEYGNHEHKNNIRIAESLIEKYNINLSNCRFRSFSQIRSGIKILLESFEGFFEIEILLELNGIRTYILKRGDTVLVRETFTSYLTVEADNEDDIILI